LFVAFAAISFIATWLLGWFGGLAAAVGSGYIMGLMGRSGGQTFELFATPLAGVVLGAFIAVELPFREPTISLLSWLLLVSGFIGYFVGHVAGLRTFRRYRIPSL